MVVTLALWILALALRIKSKGSANSKTPKIANAFNVNNLSILKKIAFKGKNKKKCFGMGKRKWRQQLKNLIKAQPKALASAATKRFAKTGLLCESKKKGCTRNYLITYRNWYSNYPNGLLPKAKAWQTKYKFPYIPIRYNKNVKSLYKPFSNPNNLKYIKKLVAILIAWDLKAYRAFKVTKQALFTAKSNEASALITKGNEQKQAIDKQRKTSGPIGLFVKRLRSILISISLLISLFKKITIITISLLFPPIPGSVKRVKKRSFCFKIKKFKKMVALKP
ncbi:hypothetical protein GGTG_09010 [Gaeumannomyces tritici R3-111a-1]|uniref:Uncharacterized protein n=1 Tax=Gaeumannomyces tritici (strain R3-111a-1) TaxID=644352 RepID=J3P669_GAET3|nr:hypothetical protein GGTG_09010 [Gaeumannomyces tritici R3-111a-1]EJT72143.1 hypothetical protein GGTG_09010 [Gaeumannomyces tritici R3-111a-1]